MISLDDAAFGTIRSQILSMDPLPSLRRMDTTFTCEEKHKSIVQGHEDYMEAIDLVAQLGWKGKIVALHMQQYTTE